MKGKVLYIEDNFTNVQVMRAVIQRHPDVVFLNADTAEEGLALARDTQPDLILMDINLPGMSGIAALQIIRTDPALQKIPVVAISAAISLHDIERIRQAPFDLYLAKPFHLADIFNLLSTYMPA